MTRKRVSFPIDKRDWHPSLIPGPIALISTVSGAEEPNVSPKSFLQMVSLEPSILMFSGSKDGKTEENIRATGCFAVNFVDGGLTQRVSDCVRWQGAERIEKSGFRLSPATTIGAPLVDNCRAHLECKLHDTKEVGSGFVVFGEIVAGSIVEEIANPEALSEHFTRYVYLMNHARPDLFEESLVRAHVAHLKRLEDSGTLELCGPFPNHSGGMVILRGVSEEEARDLAEADPFISSGAETYELRKLEVSCRDNNHLGMG